MCFEFWSIGQNVLQMLYFKIKSMLFEKDDGRYHNPQNEYFLAQKVYFFEDDGRAVHCGIVLRPPKNSCKFVLQCNRR